MSTKVVEAAVVTANGQSAGFNVAEAVAAPWLREGEAALHEGVDEVAIAVAVSAVTGTSPTLDIEVEWSPDDGTTWFSAETPDAFAQVASAASVVKRFPAKARMARLVYVVGGTTPSFTVSAWVEPLG